MDQPPNDIRHCQNCGKLLPASVSLCAECGRRVNPKASWIDAAVLLPIIFIALPCAAIGTCALVTGPLSVAWVDHAYDFINYTVAVFAFLFCFAVVSKANQIRKKKIRDDEHDN